MQSLPKNSIDLIGLKFARLTVTSLSSERKAKQLCWECKCDCGSTIVVRSYDLRSGNTKSCGCFMREKATQMATKHGDSRSKEYFAWNAMCNRCTNPAIKSFARYGGRGIKVCDRWLDSFENFLEDMGRAPTEGHSLDRRENDGDYEPGNCRWTNWTTQMNNTSRNVYYDVLGGKFTLGQLAKKTGIKYTTLLCRVARGWTIHKAVSEPVNKKCWKINA